MSCLVDASSPIRFSGLITPPNSITSASFTAPANSLLVVCLQINTTTGSDAVFAVSDSGGLAWTTRITRASTEATAGGTSAIATAPQVTSASRTVTVTWTSGGDASPPFHITAVVYVVTGADLTGTPMDAVTSDNESGSTTNDYTTIPLVPGANGLLFASDADWQAGGVFDAGDLTQDTVNFPGNISVCSGWKLCARDVNVTARLNGNTTLGVQHKECRLIVREPLSLTAALLGNRPALLRTRVPLQQRVGD